MRELVTVEELEAWLTNELRKLEDCSEAKVSGIMRLQGLDSDGCNWSDELKVNAGGVSHAYYGDYLGKIVLRARTLFNVL